jgi:MarR family transcriptional regulator, 2-MHQ and catechol-resistance regulon repressor
MTDDLFDDPRLTASGLFVEAFEGYRARLDQVHARHGLTGTDFDVLVRLARSPGTQLRMSDLAAQTALSTSGLTRVVDRLEARGLVQRIACPGDRRSWLVEITDVGRERLDADVPDVIDAIQEWLTGPIPTDQLPVFLAALRTVRDTVRPGATEGASRGAEVDASARS